MSYAASEFWREAFAVAVRLVDALGKAPCVGKAPPLLNAHLPDVTWRSKRRGVR